MAGHLIIVIERYDKFDNNIGYSMIQHITVQSIYLGLREFKRETSIKEGLFKTYVVNISMSRCALKSSSHSL